MIQSLSTSCVMFGGLYVDPPAHAIVLSVDEKSQIQALDRAPRSRSASASSRALSVSSTPPRTISPR
jgi:hypothetical protein